MIIHIDNTVFTVNENEAYTVLRLINSVIIPKINDINIVADDAKKAAENAQGTANSAQQAVLGISTELAKCITDLNYNTTSRIMIVTFQNKTTKSITFANDGLSELLLDYKNNGSVTCDDTGIEFINGVFESTTNDNKVNEGDSNIKLPIVPGNGIIIDASEDNKKAIIKGEIASATQLGMVKIGSGINKSSDGTISVSGGGGGSGDSIETGTFTAAIFQASAGASHTSWEEIPNKSISGKYSFIGDILTITLKSVTNISEAATITANKTPYISLNAINNIFNIPNTAVNYCVGSPLNLAAVQIEAYPLTYGEGINKNYIDYFAIQFQKKPSYGTSTEAFFAGTNGLIFMTPNISFTINGVTKK